MHVINFSINGPRDKVIRDLTEAATDSPETEIRQAIADHLERAADPDDGVSVSVSVTLTGD